VGEIVIPDLIRDPHSVRRSHEPRRPPQPLWIPALRFAAAGMTRRGDRGRDDEKGAAAGMTRKGAAGGMKRERVADGRARGRIGRPRIQVPPSAAPSTPFGKRAPFSGGSGSPRDSRRADPGSAVPTAAEPPVHGNRRPYQYPGRVQRGREIAAALACYTAGKLCLPTRVPAS
jgi:hypothetical protein